MKDLLGGVVAAVEAEGERLAAEFLRPDGPRGRRGSAPIDTEIEERLRKALQALLDCPFLGEETGLTPGGDAGFLWLVDPQDGTSEFTGGRRGSAVSVALLKAGVPVLGVVCSPLSPDRGRDTIAWAEGAGPIRRNGRALDVDLSQRTLVAGELVFATASSALRPGTWSRAVAPARYVAMPSIAYRLARVAAGDGVATLSVHGVSEYDVAAGLALVRAAGGVMLDAQAKPVALTGAPDARLTGCFAGAPAAAAQLAGFDWAALEKEPPLARRVQLGFPRKADEQRLARAQGCLLGQVIGDSPGSLVEVKAAAEMALALARSLAAERAFNAEKVRDAYREWMTTTGSESNGSLVRVSPLGVFAAGESSRAAAMAREDSRLTHPDPVCVEACAAYAAALAAGVAGASRDEMRAAALANSSGRAREAIERASPPEDLFAQMGPVLVALQNAFFRLRSSSFEEALAATVAAGGDTGTNAAICGALLGAALGRDAIPSRWILPVLACRAAPDAGAPRPRPAAYWPDDILELAEALLP